MRPPVPSSTKNSFIEYFNESLRHEEGIRRIYRDVELGTETIDILTAGDFITGYLFVLDPRDVKKAVRRIPTYEASCNTVFVVYAGLSDFQLKEFPEYWGFFDLDGPPADISAGVYEGMEEDQLELLTTAELREIERITDLDADEISQSWLREDLIEEIADRYTYQDLTPVICGYLLRRGTALDKTNPEGSVPRAARKDFPRDVTEDTAAMQLILPSEIPSISTQQGKDKIVRMNRQQRRAAARAAAKAEMKKGTADTGRSPDKPSAEFQQLFLDSVPKRREAHDSVTDELIKEVQVFSSQVAETLDRYRDELNDFAEICILPEPQPVHSRPNVPDEYIQRRRIYSRVACILGPYLDDHSYFSPETYDLHIALYTVATALEREDPEIGPDTTEHRVKFEDIEVRPGVPWLAKEIINDFADYLLYGYEQPDPNRKTEVAYTPLTGSWHVQQSRVMFFFAGGISRMESEYGLPDYNAFKVLESLLNLQQPKFKSEEKTAAVLEKQEYMLKEFRRWLEEDPWRRWMVEEGYNKFFNRFHAGSYDGSRLRFPGLADSVELYPYQKDAVARILKEKSTLLAFDVGAGKTYIMAAAAMKMRAEGKSPKNLFVVPNNIVGQWEQIFHRMYPQARLLLVEPKTFTPARRAAILEDIRDNDYDAVIMAYSSFEMIRLSEKEVERQHKAVTDPVNKVLRKHGRRDPAVSKARQYVRAVDAEAKAVKKSLAPKEGEPTLDELGITTLFVDEAHNFKNVPIWSSLQNVAGISLKGSQKNLNMLYKVRAVQRGRKRGRTVFATGTPLSNSLADCYTMQRYLQPELLHESHLEIFDNWLKTFAKPELVCEIDVDASRFRYVNRLSRFYNLPELSRIFAINADFYAMDEENLPELQGYTNILIPEDRNLRSYMDELVRRTERIRSHRVAPHVDNMLLVSTDGRKAALDLRLVGREQADNESSKVFRCAREVMKIYNEDPDFTQIVFCDYSTPKNGRFSVYEDLKRQLMEAGVPEKEIAFVHSATTEKKKLELYRKVNTGEIRILIGSTFKLGLGANVQTKLKAIHHLDIPWRPADMVQREGRILRKGNLNEEVRIFRYITEGSFDAYSWQTLETKQKFISQFLTGSTYERSATDLEDNILTYAQVKALAVNEPLMKVLAEKQNELRRISLLASNYVQTQDSRRGSLSKLGETERRLRRFADQTQENAAFLAKVESTEYQQLYKNISKIYTVPVLTGEEPIPEPGRQILEFDVSLPPAEERRAGKPEILLNRGGAEYRIPMSDKPAGNARRIINFFKKFQERVEKAEEAARGAQERIAGTETVLQEENPYPAQAAKLAAEIRELQNEIVGRQQKRAEDAVQPV